MHFERHFLKCLSKCIKNSEYDQEIPQSQTADNPWHCEEEPLNHHKTPGRQIKQSNQLFSRKPEKILSFTTKFG